MTSSSQSIDGAVFRRELETELRGNILPFWMDKVPDRVNGGFYGALTNDLKIENNVPRSAILCARILWTFAAAARKFGAAEYLETAHRAFASLTDVFWDKEYGGLFWEVDKHGRPVRDEKFHYAQAFGIYALAEYYCATGFRESLELAWEIFRLLETYAHDKANGGYHEGSDHAWQELGENNYFEDFPYRKSMNTTLHLLEACTALLRTTGDPALHVRHRELIELFLTRIIDRKNGCFRLFFDEAWRPLDSTVSFGHDIEGSWLLTEAADADGAPGLRERVREASLSLADTVLRGGLDADGSIYYERGPDGAYATDKHWWVQAEGIVGFYNAFQLTGNQAYAHAVARIWEYAQRVLVDKQNGDWFKVVRADGTPAPWFKVGPWECPYHHARMCLQMLERLEESTPVE